jgi:type III secretory pathway component EscT
MLAPALRPVNPALPLPLALLAEAARGLPVAIGAAVMVHTALMAGGVVDDLRGARAGSSLPVFDAEHTPLGALLGLLVALALLEAGAPAKLVATLAQAAPGGTLPSLVATLSASVGIALAVAAPIVGVAVVLSVAEALFSRAASPAHITQLLVPLRSIALLAVLALALERIQAALLLATRI